MTQQQFSIEKTLGIDIIYSRSVYGDNVSPQLKIQPETELEFLIFNGGVSEINIDISAIPADQAQFYNSYNSKISDANSYNKLRTHSNIEIMEVYSETSLSANNLKPVKPIDSGILDDSIRPLPQPPSNYGNVPQVPITVKLFRTNENEPVYTWDLPASTNSQYYRTLRLPFTHDLQGNPVITSPHWTNKLDKRGWWKCQVKIKGHIPALVKFKSLSSISKITHRTKVLGYKWLNHAFWNVLNAITPRVSFSNGFLDVQLGIEIYEHIGKKIDFNQFVLKNIPIEIQNTNIQLSAINLTATRGQEVINNLNFKIEKVNDFVNNLPISFFSNSHITKEKLITVLTKKYIDIKNKFKPNDAVIKFMPIFSNPSLEGKLISSFLLNFEVKFDESPSIYIGFGQNKNKFLHKPVKVWSDISDINLLTTGLLDILLIKPVELFKDVETWVEDILNSGIQIILEQYGEEILSYLYQALGKALGINSVVEGLTSNSNGWNVQYYNAFDHPDPAKPYLPGLFDTVDDIISPFGESLTVPGTEITETVERGNVTGYTDANIPKSFKLGSKRDLSGLDQIETLVIVMMENRSFDHFLGDLHRTYPQIGYKCFDPNFTNPAAGNFINPIKVCKASEAIFPRDVNITPISPEHGFDHVMRQLSDGSYDIHKHWLENDLSKLGSMQGFTHDILDRFSEKGENKQYPDDIPFFESPQLPMIYYTKDELPVYYHLAENFKVLDHWFAAHPGGTYPNRIATYTGRIRNLYNYGFDDPEFGFLKDKTVFDVLSAYNIDWKYLESNISIMRLFDKYRLDDKNVIPLHSDNVITADKLNLEDDLKELDTLLKKDKLPRVLVIEPRFSDVPPLNQAYDDLAPANIGSGQYFICQVYKKLLLNRKHGHKFAMLITYDEHGGFFDHLPPPGTPLSEFPDPVPPIYFDKKDPDKKAPTHLGVRVPAILVSHFIKKQSVSHTVFDHTSILKTILVHNRNKIPPQVLTSFGERVNQANHLGMALDFFQEKPTQQQLDSRNKSLIKQLNKLNLKNNKLQKITIPSYYSMYNNINKFDFHETLRRLYMPRN